MPWLVITYDISDDRRREKVARLLLHYGDRIQQSVFTASMEKNDQDELRAQLAVLLRPGDRCEMFPVDQRLREFWVSWKDDVEEYSAIRVFG